MSLEEMSLFFNQRADSYDSHMLDELHLTEFYDEIETCIALKPQCSKFLDLGCGTGLELERVFRLCHEAQVTAIDLSEGMLGKLKEKFCDHLSDLTVICGSYFDVDFGMEQFDCALSTYSLHHFNREDKLNLYKKIYDAIRLGGSFINGDYTVKTFEDEEFYERENIRIRREQGIKSGFYHYDTPFSIQTEVDLLKKAGFAQVTIHKQWDKSTIFLGIK